MFGSPLGSRGIKSPAPLRDRSDLAFAAVGGATALAFAVVLALAAVGAGLTAALAFAIVLAFAAVLARVTVVSELSGAERGDGAGGA